MHLNQNPEQALKEELRREASITLTADGGATLWSQRYAQHYHNRHGALTQAQHVYLEGSFTHQHLAPCVLEIGFGVGLNFLTTLHDASARGVSLNYLAYEFDPQPVTVLRAIGNSHPGSHLAIWQDLLNQWPSSANQDMLHKTLKITHPGCSLEIRFEDATAANFPPAWATAVYLDGFSPDANPELWTEDFIGKLTAAMQPEAWMASYSTAGRVKRAIAYAGLKHAKRPGMTGKRDCLHAQKLAIHVP